MVNFFEKWINKMDTKLEGKSKTCGCSCFEKDAKKESSEEKKD